MGGYMLGTDTKLTLMIRDTHDKSLDVSVVTSSGQSVLDLSYHPAVEVYIRLLLELNHADIDIPLNEQVIKFVHRVHSVSELEHVLIVYCDHVFVMFSSDDHLPWLSRYKREEGGVSLFLSPSTILSVCPYHNVTVVSIIKPDITVHTNISVAVKSSTVHQVYIKPAWVITTLSADSDHLSWLHTAGDVQIYRHRWIIYRYTSTLEPDLR